MSTPVKIGIVLAGYALALLGAFAATSVHVLFTQGPAAQASSGMYAFGDLLLFLVAFGALALIPTVLGFYFLRSHEKFWTWSSVACLVFSLAGLLVALANIVIRGSVLLSLAWLVGATGTPVFTIGFLFLARIAPSMQARQLLIISALFEIFSALLFLATIFNAMSP